MGRGMPDLYTTGMSKLVCKGWAVAKSRTRVSEISSRLCKEQAELQRQKEQEVM